jgi:hypothetical protein
MTGSGMAAATSFRKRDRAVGDMPATCARRHTVSR